MTKFKPVLKVKKILLDQSLKISEKTIAKTAEANNFLTTVADVFLFGCYTGYAYSDLKRLSPENLVTSDDGKLWIHARRYKTDMISHVPLLPAAKEILAKYRFDKYCIVKNVLLPVLSNQKLNSYLKEIADVCGIEKEILKNRVGEILQKEP